jgi:hypothetical protein
LTCRTKVLLEKKSADVHTSCGVGDAVGGSVDKIRFLRTELVLLDHSGRPVLLSYTYLLSCEFANARARVSYMIAETD